MGEGILKLQDSGTCYNNLIGQSRTRKEDKQNRIGSPEAQPNIYSTITYCIKKTAFKSTREEWMAI